MCCSSCPPGPQVTDTCNSVYVGGKENRGARGARVDFWFRRLHASLLFTVWVPLLPLRIELTDTTLEQVRGWRVPGATPDRSVPLAPNLEQGLGLPEGCRGLVDGQGECQGMVCWEDTPQGLSRGRVGRAWQAERALGPGAWEGCVGDRGGGDMKEAGRTGTGAMSRLQCTLWGSSDATVMGAV